MTINILDLLQIELYVVLIVLIIVLIIAGIKLIKTLSKIDCTIDEVNEKLTKVDGVFNVVEKTGTFVDKISDKAIMLLSSLIGKFINKKKGNDDYE